MSHIAMRALSLPVFTTSVNKADRNHFDLQIGKLSTKFRSVFNKIQIIFTCKRRVYFLYFIRIIHPPGFLIFATAKNSPKGFFVYWFYTFFFLNAGSVVKNFGYGCYIRFRFQKRGEEKHVHSPLS